MRQNSDPQILHGNHIRTTCSRTSPSTRIQSIDKVGIIIWNNDTAGKSSSNKEEPEAEIDGFECSLEVFTGMGGFTSHHGDVFWAYDCETRRSVSD